MTPDQINDIANWIALSAVIPFAGYWATYGVGSPWYRSLLGVVMFGLGMSITMVLVYVTVRRMLGNFPGYEWWSVGVYTFLALVGWALWAIVIVERRRAPLLLQIPLKRKAGLMAIKTEDGTPVTVPDIWYKAQRVLRTIVSVGIPAFLTFALVLPQIIEALGLPADSEVRLWLLGIAAAVTAVAAAITRIMAIPKVNEWLTKIGLGSVPKAALEAEIVSEGGAQVHVITTVAPDPKANTQPEAVG